MTPAGPRRFSLRGRLLLTTIGLWIVGAWSIYLESRQVGERLSDEALKETGALLLQLAEHEIAEHGLSLGVLLLRNEALSPENEFRYQIWTEATEPRKSPGSAGAPTHCGTVITRCSCRSRSRWTMRAAWRRPSPCA